MRNLLMANGMGHLSGADVSLGDPNCDFGLDLAQICKRCFICWDDLVAEMQWWKVILMVTVGGQKDHPSVSCLQKNN